MILEARGAASASGPAECARALEDILKLLRIILDTPCSLLLAGGGGLYRSAHSAWPEFVFYMYTYIYIRIHISCMYVHARTYCIYIKLIGVFKEFLVIFSMSHFFTTYSVGKRRLPPNPRQQNNKNMNINDVSRF